MHRIGRPKAPGRRDPSPEDQNPQLLSHPRGLSPFSRASFSQAVVLFVRSLLLYILLLHSSSSYTYRSSMPILECTSHRPLFMELCELLWPPLYCPGVTSTSMGLGCQLWVFNAEVTAFPRVAFLPCSYSQLVGLGIPFVIFKGIVLGDMAPSYPVILACRGKGHPRQYILAVWIPFVRPRILLLSRRKPWTWNGMGQALQNLLKPQ